MAFLKPFIVFTIIACGLEATELTVNDQGTKCTFHCKALNDVSKTQAACGKVTERDAHQNPIKWNLVPAHPTDGHLGYYNCIGTNMAFSTCCKPGTVPKEGKSFDAGTDHSQYAHTCENTIPIA
ncbi:hypothetical protein PTTG_28926 [Puccinia triticina 1-1 BBBD Race 1]|uniref:Uncharacterized protein n=1 Tax=Puccinia triticina (isolate 1-1 / race 1 (BBBD)) TaxID=630390 RepID=A0A180G8G0_PUCT1|nr:hypothetical protein PTTG_28926 [Puccinia triticina 1-1 BBBD Race 1]